MLEAIRRAISFLRQKQILHKLGVAVSVTVIGIACYVLYHMLRGIDVDEVIEAIKETEPRQIVLAALFVAAGYFTLTFYDLFAVRAIGRNDIPYRINALAAFTSYSIGHNVGASVFTGGAVRYRIYSAWGLNAIDVAKICFLAGLTFWLGNAAVLGLGIAYHPEAASAIDQLPPWLNRLAAFAIILALVGLCGLGLDPAAAVGRGPWTVVLPGGPLTLLQIAIGIVDLGFCALAMYVLVPDEPNLGFVVVAVIFVSATLLGFASHSPGGLGVFDAAMLVGLWQMDREDLLAGMLLFRVLYYIAPFVISVILLTFREVILGARNKRLRQAAPGARSPSRAAKPPMCESAATPAPDDDRPEGKSRPDGDRSCSSSFYSPWPDRLRHSAIILLAAGLALAVLVAFGELSLLRAAAIFVCIAAAALVPWRLHDAVASREDVRGVNPVETAAVSAVVAGMPDPAVLLDRAGRVIHLNAAAAQLAPALRKNELAQFALRSPEIITALREAIATTETRRATYLDHVPVDRWMELIITPVPVPTLFGGTDKCMLMTFHDQTPLRRVEEMRADFVANASHELRTPLAALSGFIDTLQGPAKEDAKARERFLGIMHTQATRMARLIDDLLSLSRVELSAHVRPDTLVDIVPIIRQVADGLEPLARERQVASISICRMRRWRSRAIARSCCGCSRT